MSCWMLHSLLLAARLTFPFCNVREAGEPKPQAERRQSSGSVVGGSVRWRAVYLGRLTGDLASRRGALY